MGTSNMAGAIQLFMAEKKNYHGQPIGQGNFESYGHYTQVVSRRSTQVGCYYDQVCRTTVCNYYLPGNLVGSVIQ